MTPAVELQEATSSISPAVRWQHTEDATEVIVPVNQRRSVACACLTPCHSGNTVTLPGVCCSDGLAGQTAVAETSVSHVQPPVPRVASVTQ